MLKDNDSWRSESNPLLYTSGLVRKPAWYAVRSALRHRKIVKEQTDVRSIHDDSLDAQATYDLSGRSVSEPQRGNIYLQNGIKVRY